MGGTKPHTHSTSWQRSRITTLISCYSPIRPALHLNVVCVYYVYPCHRCFHIYRGPQTILWKYWPKAPVHRDAGGRKEHPPAPEPPPANVSAICHLCRLWGTKHLSARRSNQPSKSNTKLMAQQKLCSFGYIILERRPNERSFYVLRTRRSWMVPTQNAAGSCKHPWQPLLPNQYDYDITE